MIAELSHNLAADAAAALARFQHDLWIVNESVPPHYDEGARSELESLRRRALYCATQAFLSGGDPEHGAWADLVLIVKRLLRYRDESWPADDEAVRARLQAFVDENEGATEALLARPAS